jgi:hypothetical protein
MRITAGLSAQLKVVFKMLSQRCVESVGIGKGKPTGGIKALGQGNAC